MELLAKDKTEIFFLRSFYGIFNLRSLGYYLGLTGPQFLMAHAPAIATPVSQIIAD
jgi:hypothetical protein